MTAYLLSVLGASFAVALVNLLAPESSAGHLRFLSSLLLVCVLIAPLPSAIEGLEGITGELTDRNDGDNRHEESEELLEEALNSASRTYFAQTLTRMLADRFEISEENLRCAIRWEEDGEQSRPSRVTVILSGDAIWENPDGIEQFVSALLGCECVTAIE